MSELVGPVVHATSLGKRFVEVLGEQNPGLLVVDHGAYVRAMVPRKCVLSRRQLVARLGHEFVFPQDLEKLISSFRGRMQIDDERVIWYANTPEA